MRTLIGLSVLLLALSVASPLGADDEPKPKPKPTFPASWEGIWKGPCQFVRIGSDQGKPFPMELHVARSKDGKSWTWTIVYGEGKKQQVRPYILRAVEGEPARYQIDERNGIVLDAFFENENLHNRFRVGKSLLEATYTREADRLRVTITTFGAQPTSTTGGKGGKGGVPAVDSYAMTAVQRGVLQRKPNERDR